MSHRFFIGVSLAALIAVSGCMGKEDGINLASVRGAKIETSEQLLAAEGDWTLVEDERAQDPLDMHSSARKQVNPNNRSSKQYVPQDKVASAAGTQGKDDVNFRLIRMQRDMKGVKVEPDIMMAEAAMMGDADEADSGADSGTATGADFAAADAYETQAITMQDTAADMIVPERKPSGSSVSCAAAEAQSGADLVRDDDPVISVISKLAPAAGTEDDGRGLITSSSANTGSTVTGIRFGDYPEKTRMVLDLNADADFTADVQNGRVLLELPKSAWASAQHQVLNNPLIKSYTASPSRDGGTVLSLELKKPVKLLGSAALPPNSQYGHRIYLDLTAS